MDPTTPELTHELFVKYFNEANVDALLALYEPVAVLFPAGTAPASGHSEIREALKGFLARQGHMRLTVDRVLQADNIALLFSSWTLEGWAPDGTPHNTAGQTTDIVRRQPDGSWLLLIDNPQGAAAAGK